VLLLGRESHLLVKSGGVFAVWTLGFVHKLRRPFSAIKVAYVKALGLRTELCHDACEIIDD
jgi:hypothetical protein